MGAKTGIEYVDCTWNPWQGCTKVSRGCDNCYMYREKKGHGQDPTKVVRSSSRTFNLPLAKKRDGSWKVPSGSRVFVCSWSDFFHEDADEWRAEAFTVMGERPDLFFLIPTKRPRRMVEHLSELRDSTVGLGGESQMWKHLWPGVSVEDQATADERIPELLRLDWPGVTWVSLEPLLGPVRLGDALRRRIICGQCKRPFGENIQRADSIPDCRCAYCGTDIAVHAGRKDPSWVVAGGESGPNARPCHPDWFRRIRDDCVQAGVPFFFKQWGKWVPRLQSPALPLAKVWGTLDIGGDWSPLAVPWNGVQGDESDGREYVMHRVGKKAAGRVLDGRAWDEFPGGLTAEGAEAAERGQ